MFFIRFDIYKQLEVKKLLANFIHNLMKLQLISLIFSSLGLKMFLQRGTRVQGMYTWQVTREGAFRVHLCVFREDSSRRARRRSSISSDGRGYKNCKGILLLPSQFENFHV